MKTYVQTWNEAPAAAGASRRRPTDG